MAKLGTWNKVTENAENSGRFARPAFSLFLFCAILLIEFFGFDSVD